MTFQRAGKFLSALLALVLIVACFPVKAAAEKWNVTPSNKDYSVSIPRMAGGVFISNKDTIGSAVGTEYYMTYTVKSAEIYQTPCQLGIIGTTDPTIFYPYGTGVSGHGGVMYWEPVNVLLEEGKTYFLKFTITKDGFDYRVGWAEGEDSRYIEFSQTVIRETRGLTHFGIWFEAFDYEAELIKVRCYDKYGNDLGVRAGREEAVVYVNNPMEKDTEVPHKYDIKVTDQVLMSFTNRFKPTSDKIYFEYTVKSMEKAKLEQAGVILSNAPYATYPYLYGSYYYNQYSRTLENMDSSPLLEEGASYIICCEKKADKMAIRVEKTKNGKTTLIDFGLTYGDYYNDQFFYSIFFCGVGEHPNSFEFTDFKCYDSNKKNLGVVCNLPAEITHYGDYEQMEGLDGVYYDKENKVRLDLNPDMTAILIQDGTEKKGTFTLSDGLILTTVIDGVEQSYDYFYNFISNDTCRFDRLKTYKIIFNTGNGSAVETQIVGKEQNFQAVKPADPTMKGTSFVCWCTSDGEEYQFGDIVTESLTLYAKWSDTHYAAQSPIVETLTVTGLETALLGAVVLLLSVMIAIILIKREKKHAKTK